PCGTGACTACTLQTRQGSVLACTEGPAFDLTQFSF
ncbi:MAG: dihydroorotate dehydrogenase electron transfer subunit, partial [Chloroflexota bacterium]